VVRARRVTLIDVENRAKTGPKIDEKEWDFKIIPQKTRELVKEYGIKIDRKTFIPDGDMADRIYEAGFRLLTELGIYCMTTGRVIKVTEDEIRDGLKHAPRELVLGTGRDAVRMVQRKAGGSNYEVKPIIQGGPTGAPCSEKWFVQMHTSYAQEAVVDTIVNGVLSTFQGWEVVPGSVVELKAVKVEQQLVRLACSNAGRPGMAV
jgi:methylamine--corrinoid protein Co-methyltransferase